MTLGSIHSWEHEYFALDLWSQAKYVLPWTYFHSTLKIIYHITYARNICILDRMEIK